ncbi:MAG TPA: hypothetical protein VES60_03015 [Nakamurella sp.]|nr:hypothetical protein [Nakamurella sp.]
MEMSAGLAADLARLTDALDDSATDLADLVGSLHEAFVVAVPSALGLAFTIRASPDLTIRASPAGVTVSTLDGAATAVATSLQVPLGSWTDLEPGSAVVFYAAATGALVDLAADLGWLLNIRAAVVLDGHLQPAQQQGVMSGLAEMSVVQQAVGVLIDRGMIPQAGRDELEHLARESDTTVHAVAAQLIRDCQSADPPGD